jgi:hypothetical protein
VWYHYFMKHLTVEHVRRIMGWSYPTALKFAKEHGRQCEEGRQEWSIPAHAVEAAVDAQLDEAFSKKRMLMEMIK